MTAHCFPSESCTASTRQHGHNHVPFRCPSPRRQAIPLLFPEPGFLVDHDALVFNLVVISLHASAFAFARPFSIRRNQFREPCIVPVDMEGTDFVPATLFLRPFADVPIPLRGIHQDRVDRVCRLADCLAPRFVKLLLVPYPFEIDPFAHVPDGVADEAYRQDDEGCPVATRLIPWPLRYQGLRRVEDDFLGDEAMEEIFVELRCVCSIGSGPVEHLELVHVSGWF